MMGGKVLRNGSQSGGWSWKKKEEESHGRSQKSPEKGPRKWKPGSHKEKERLYKLQLEGVKEGEELKMQRLAAMGQSRYKRLLERAGKEKKEPKAKQTTPEQYNQYWGWQQQMQWHQWMQSCSASPWPAQPLVIAQGWLGIS